MRAPIIQEGSECPQAQLEGSPSPFLLGELQKTQSKTSHCGMEQLLLVWSW